MVLDSPHHQSNVSFPDPAIFGGNRVTTEGTRRDQIGPVSPISTNPAQIPPTPDAPHVLVLDDNPEILDLLGQLLSDEAYRVTLATWLIDPGMILELGPDLIITDAIFNLRSEGLRFIRDIRQHPATRHIPVICCTGMRPAPHDLAMIGVPVIAKPFDLDAIVDIVASTVRKPGTLHQGFSGD